jgi:hypothetical protein
MVRLMFVYLQLKEAERANEPADQERQRRQYFLKAYVVSYKRSPSEHIWACHQFVVHRTFLLRVLPEAEPLLGRSSRKKSTRFSVARREQARRKITATIPIITVSCTMGESCPKISMNIIIYTTSLFFALVEHSLHSRLFE